MKHVNIYHVYGRGTQHHEVAIYEIPWYQMLHQKVWHWFFCQQVERRLPKRLSNWRIYNPGFNDDRVPLYVWFDLSCPGNTGRYMRNRQVYRAKITGEEYEALK